MSAQLQEHIGAGNQVNLFKMKDGPAMTRDQIIAYARLANLTAAEVEVPKPVIIRENDRERIVERTDGKVVRLLKTQDPKYGILIETTDGEHLGHYANMESGFPIPRDEPVFLIRGQDLCAAAGVDGYCRAAQDHATAIESRTVESAAAALERIFDFQAKNPHRCKLPT